MPAAALGSLITSVTCHNVTEGYTSQVLPPLPVWRPYFEGLKSGSDWNRLTPKVTLSSGGAGGHQSRTRRWGTEEAVVLAPVPEDGLILPQFCNNKCLTNFWGCLPSVLHILQQICGFMASAVTSCLPCEAVTSLRGHLPSSSSSSCCCCCCCRSIYFSISLS